MAVGQEITFTFDNFQKPKMLSLRDTVAQMFVNLLVMRPGNLPSLPHIGIDIRQYLYRAQSDINPDDLRQKIFNQASELMPYISLGEVMVFVTRHENRDLLIVSIPLMGVDGSSTDLLIGAGAVDGDVNIAYQFEDISTDTSN